MPIIIKEWLCRDCGTTFESSDAEPECPQCTAEEPERVFLTPPGIKSPDTSRKDTIVKELAADYGLSNVSNRHGEAVKKTPSGPAAPSFTNHNPQVSAMLQKLGGNADGFSGVLPTLRQAGGPRKWAKVPDKR